MNYIDVISCELSPDRTSLANAAYALTTGDKSIAIGSGAMNVHTTGARNIAIGYEAMNDTDAGSTSLGSDDNIFIGYDAGGGTWLNNTSEKNIALGNNICIR